MKASVKFLTLCLLLLAPISAAHAQGPSLSPIGNVTMNAGGSLNVNVVAVDPLNRPITVTADLPPFATLNTPTIGTGVVVTNITLTPSSGQVGDYSAAVSAEAGGVSFVRVVLITVNPAGSNLPPLVTAPALQEITEGAPLTFTVTASDPDGDAITSLSAMALPWGATFTPSGDNKSGTFSWTPATGDAGEYDVQFTAANGLSSTSSTHIRVSGAPALAITPIPDVTVAGGGSLSVPVHASGVVDALISLTAALPSFAMLNPPGSGTGEVNTTVSITPPTGSAGTYHASITAISNSASVTEMFDIIVTGDVGGSNHPPVVTAPATETVAIGSTLTFDVTATDPDGDHVDLIGSALPPGSSFTDHANNSGTFTWTPVAGQGGTYTASFTGLDGKGASGSASTQITVTGDVVLNHPPTVSAPAALSANVGDHISFTVTASDPDADPVALSASSLPSGATFIDHGDDTGTFSWTPGATQLNSFTIGFLGFDGKGGSGTAQTIITVSQPTAGGGGDVPGTACLIGKFKMHRDNTCFRIRPVGRSFDLKDVVLSSIRLQLHGQSIAALDGAQIETRCHDGDHHGDDGDDDDQGEDRGKSAVPTSVLHDSHDGHGDGHGDDDGDDQGEDDECNVTCRDGHEHEGFDLHAHKTGCDTLGIRACFPTASLVRMLLLAKASTLHGSHDWKPMACALLDAQILATLTNGSTVVATFGNNGNDPDNGHGDDDHGHGHGDGHEDRALSAKLTPNPLHPSTVLSFATTVDGQVKVVVYDMQGRVVKRLLNEYRAAGSQSLGWDGTNEWNVRVPSGLYFLRIQSPEASVTRRVSVVQ